MNPPDAVVGEPLYADLGRNSHFWTGTSLLLPDQLLARCPGTLMRLLSVSCFRGRILQRPSLTTAF